MPSPELIENIHANWQEIFDGGIRVASLLAGEDAIYQALEMKKAEREIMSGLSEEEERAYYGRDDAFEGFAESFRPQNRIDAAIEGAARDQSEIPEHDKLIEVAEKAPLIAINRVEDAQGFVLDGLDPPLRIMGGVLLQAPPKERPPMFIEAPRGFVLKAVSAPVGGEEILSQMAKILRLSLVSNTLLRFYQSNTYIRMGRIEENDATGEFPITDGLSIPLELPPPEEVEPDLDLAEINQYLTRYAKGLTSMESLPTAELREAIMPHLELGWKPDTPGS